MSAGQIKVVGCGNLLFGDDGFGPAVINFLQLECQLPKNIEVIDAGTGAGDLLLDALLGEGAPDLLILIDALDLGLSAGTVKEIDVDQIPENKKSDFSVHQFSTLNILKELKNKGVEVHLIGCQVESIPEEMSVGLSKMVANAVPETVNRIINMVTRV